MKEKMSVFGKQYLDFPGKNGEQVKGIKLHCTKEASKNWEGLGYEGFFVEEGSATYEKAKNIVVPANIEITSYRRSGKVADFELCK